MPKRERPNIVLITLDECKASALGCYGNEDSRTPNMDKLADAGIRFTHAFATCPKCVPSRSSMLTGRYPHSEGHRTLPGFAIREGEDNLMLHLKRAGYETALFGDGTHWVDPDNHERCFDVTGRTTAARKVRQLPDERDEIGMFRAMYRPEAYVGEEMEDARQAALAVDYIDSRAGDSLPFFMIYDLQLPHPPYLKVDPYIGEFEGKKVRVPEIEPLKQAPATLRRYREVYGLEQLDEEQWRQIVRAYYSMIAMADDCIGRVIDALDRSGLVDDTIVVLTSDHGDFAGEHGAVEKWDTLFYDCLMHVPFIVRYPARIRKGGTSEALTDNVDLVPTLLELCGLPGAPAIHGWSLAGILDGTETEHKAYVFGTGGVEAHAIDMAVPTEDEFYTLYPTYVHKQKVMITFPETMHRAKMIRNRKWKLVYRLNGSRELYDLENDPGERRDVSSHPEYKETVAELIEQLLRFSISTETDYPGIRHMLA